MEGLDLRSDSITFVYYYKAQQRGKQQGKENWKAEYCIAVQLKKISSQSPQLSLIIQVKGTHKKHSDLTHSELSPILLENSFKRVKRGVFLGEIDHKFGYKERAQSQSNEGNA